MGEGLHADALRHGTLAQRGQFLIGETYVQSGHDSRVPSGTTPLFGRSRVAITAPTSARPAAGRKTAAKAAGWPTVAAVTPSAVGAMEPPPSAVKTVPAAATSRTLASASETWRAAEFAPASACGDRRSSRTPSVEIDRPMPTPPTHQATATIQAGTVSS